MVIPHGCELRSASATSFHLSNRLRAKAQEVGFGGLEVDEFPDGFHGFFWSVFLEGIYKGDFSKLGGST